MRTPLQLPGRHGIHDQHARARRGDRDGGRLRNALDASDNLLDLKSAYLDAAEIHAVVCPSMRTEVTVGEALHLVAMAAQNCP